ncbi:hypothetical protein [Spirosoma areae]
MKLYETGPARANHWVKGTPSAHELNTLVSLTVRLGKGRYTRAILKNALRAQSDPTSIDDTRQAVFYHQRMEGVSYAEVSKEFCQAVSCPGKSIVRLQITVSPALLIREEHWYPLIRYCLLCWGQSDSPAVVFGSPVSTHYMDLFMVRDSPLPWQEPTEGQQWLINRMMSICIGLWLNKPDYLTPPLISWPSHTNSGLQDEPYIARAIYESLSVQRLETIHQLTDWLRKRYGLETHYRHVENYFYDLRFRYELLPWIAADGLSFGPDDTRIWLDFNRLLKNAPISRRILGGFYERSGNNDESKPDLRRMGIGTAYSQA